MKNFAYIPVLFGLGIGTYFALPFEPSIWITLGTLEILIILAIIWRYHSYRLMIIGYIAVFALGFANIQLKTHYLSSKQSIKTQEVAYIKGQISHKDYNSRTNPRYTITNVTDFTDAKTYNKIRVTIAGSNFIIGDCIETVANLMPPFKAPFYGAYDFSKKAFYDGLQANGYSTTHAYMVECPNPTSQTIPKTRQSITNKIYKHLPKNQADIAAALIAGEKGKIPQKTIAQYRDSGLAHVLSISGMHMSMIAGFMFLLIRTILACFPHIALRYNTKKISAIIAILTATFYLLISGASIPTQRAYIMVFIVFLGILFDRKAISIKNIAIAAMIILTISPQVLISPSFQMSFAAVLAMIAFYEKYSKPINHFIKKFGIITSFISGLLIADFIASIATLPFAIYHFNKIAVYTTLGNLLAGPIISFMIMPFILLTLIAIPLGLESLPLTIVGLGIEWMNNITHYVSNLNGATYEVLSMSTWAFLLIIFGGLVLCIVQNKIRVYGIALILIGFSSMAFTKRPIAINMQSPSKFEKTLITQKYGTVKIQNKRPYGAIIYKNSIKKQKNNRIWHK